jgi:hypothetical protein
MKIKCVVRSVVLKSGDNTLKVLVTSASQGKPKLGYLKMRTVSSEKLK